MTLWILFIALIGVGGVLGQLSPPGGWLALEFPALIDLPFGNSPDSWQPRERDAALFGLGLDYLFLIIYPLFLSLLCGRAGQSWNLPEWLERASVFFSSFALFAAPLDALENFGLYFLITGNTGATLQWFITAVSALKWFIAVAASIVGVCCITIRLWRDRHQLFRNSGA